MITDVTRRMIVAEILKLRRQRTTMLTADVLSIAITLLYVVAIGSRGNGSISSEKVISSGSALLAMYFGSFMAVYIGATAGTLDLDSGVFRDLVATGRSRRALFLVRVPAAIAVALAFNLAGFAVTVLAAIGFPGERAHPWLILRYGGWVVLATVVVTALAVGLASLTGSRSLTITAVIGWQTAASTILYGAEALGSARQGLLSVALSHLRPGPAVGTHQHPGSSNALPGLVLPMSTTVAILVLAAWALIPVIAGARRAETQDA
jgi:ABC-type transport system involved in multi-copper enzyme maturation permease subunit